MAAEYHAGFDTFAYPGDKLMQSLWDNTNLTWVGFYLNEHHAWNNGKEKPKYETLDKMGWGIVPIYIGYQNRFYSRKLGIQAQQAKWKKEHPDETNMPGFTYQAHLDQFPRKLVGAEGQKDGDKTVDLAIADTSRPSQSSTSIARAQTRMTSGSITSWDGVPP